MEIVLWLLAVGIGGFAVLRVPDFVIGRWRRLWTVFSIVWLVVALGAVVGARQFQEGIDLVRVAVFTLVPPLLLYVAGLAVGWVWRRMRTSK